MNAEDLDSQIGEKMKTLMKKRGWNVADFAEKMGWKERNTYNVLGGKTHLNTVTLCKAAEVLQVEVIDLLPSGVPLPPESPVLPESRIVDGLLRTQGPVAAAQYLLGLVPRQPSGIAR
tara:strand:+ start:247 stop:600 length:354 start_codon:yes stop_codon:yes gene_type:complete